MLKQMAGFIAEGMCITIRLVNDAPTVDDLGRLTY